MAENKQLDKLKLERFIGDALDHHPDACYLLYFAYWLPGQRRRLHRQHEHFDPSPPDGRMGGRSIAIVKTGAPPYAPPYDSDVWENGGVFGGSPEGRMWLYELPDGAWKVIDDARADVEDRLEKVQRVIT